MKKLLVIIAACICMMHFTGCSKNSMNYITANKPSVTGVVEAVYDSHFILYAENAAGYPYGSRWSVTLSPENADSYTDIVIGDEVTFYYDGDAMETDPLQVGTVYAITLKTPADRSQNEQP